MTYEEVKAACRNVDELYGEVEIYPILPFVQRSWLDNHRRTYVVVWDTERNEWYDLYAYPGDTVERVKIALAGITVALSQSIRYACIRGTSQRSMASAIPGGAAIAES